MSEVPSLQVIRNFRNKRLARYWLRGQSQGLPADHLKRINLRLTALDTAVTLQELDAPGSYFHALAGDMAGRYTIRVTGNWRLTFGWDEASSDAIDVDYEDYH